MQSNTAAALVVAAEPHAEPLLPLTAREEREQPLPPALHILLMALLVLTILAATPVMATTFPLLASIQPYLDHNHSDSAGTYVAVMLLYAGGLALVSGGALVTGMMWLGVAIYHPRDILGGDSMRWRVLKRVYLLILIAGSLQAASFTRTIADDVYEYTPSALYPTVLAALLGVLLSLLFTYDLVCALMDS